MAEKRRLPVLNSRPPVSEDGDGEARPPWHWIGFGTVAIFAIWLPLSYVAELVRARVAEAWIGRPDSAEATAQAISALSADGRARLGLAIALTHGTALALASFLGGMLVGKFGGPGAGVREAALAGVMAALVATVLSWNGITWIPLATLAIAAALAALGGRAGVRRRSN